MLLARDYQRPFWRGFFHAVGVMFYCIFITLITLSMRALFNGDIGPVIQTVFYFFIIILTFAVCGYLIFFEPMKKVLHQHFRAGAVMMASTLGWLFLFLVIFLVGLVLTLPEFM